VSLVHLYLLWSPEEGAYSRPFVRPSVRPVSCTANNLNGTWFIDRWQ